MTSFEEDADCGDGDAADNNDCCNGWRVVCFDAWANDWSAETMAAAIL